MFVRPAVPDDAESVAFVHVATWREAYAGLVPEAVLAELDEIARAHMWRRALEQGRSLWVACDEEIVGFVSCGPARDEGDAPGRTGEIYALYVRASHWGRGVGRPLMRAALAELELRGFHDVTLWVLDANLRARRFYEKLGFHRDGGEKDERLPGAAVLHELRYRRALADPG